MRHLAFVNRGRGLVGSTGSAAEMYPWDTETRRVSGPITLGESRGLGDEVQSIVPSPDGSRALVALSEGALLWDLGAGKTICRIAVPLARDAALLPDGRALITDREGYSVWSLKTGNRLFGFRTAGHYPDAGMEISPDGRRELLFEGADGALERRGGEYRPGMAAAIVEVNSSRFLQFLGMSRSLASIQLLVPSPDGRHALFAGDDRSPVPIRYRDLEHGQLLHALEAWRGDPISLEFSAAGERAIASSRAEPSTCGTSAPERNR